jgi:hypothetical protein
MVLGEYYRLFNENRQNVFYEHTEVMENGEKKMGKEVKHMVYVD